MPFTRKVNGCENPSAPPVFINFSHVTIWAESCESQALRRKGFLRESEFVRVVFKSLKKVSRKFTRLHGPRKDFVGIPKNNFWFEFNLFTSSRLSPAAEASKTRENAAEQLA